MDKSNSSFSFFPSASAAGIPDAMTALNIAKIHKSSAAPLLQLLTKLIRFMLLLISAGRFRRAVDSAAEQ